MRGLEVVVNRAIECMTRTAGVSGGRVSFGLGVDEEMVGWRTRTTPRQGSLVLYGSRVNSCRHGRRQFVR